MNRLLHELRRAADVVRRNERLSAWLLLGAIGIGCLAVLTPPIRDRLLTRAQVIAARWEARWPVRVEHGEALLAEGRYEEAVAYLDQLDRIHPARHVNHGRDVERERILRALGAANLELGRKRAALDALQRAVEFDERNYLNHYTLATAALSLGEADMALAAFDRVLAINPNHEPTVAALVAHYFEGSDYRSVVDTYRAYLDAYLIQEATVRLGEGIGQVDVRVGGNRNVIDVPIIADSGTRPASGEALIIEAGPYAFTVDDVILAPTRRAGELDRDPIRIPSPGGWTSESRGDSVRRVVIPIADSTAVARVRFVLSVNKPVDVDTWAMVERSYRNLLETEALANARFRSELLDGSGPDATDESL